MRTLRQLAFLFAALAATHAQQVIDRVIVVVNDRVITQTDWDEEERFEALAEGRPPSSIKHSPASLERLIDRVLLSEQMAELNFRPAAPEQSQEEVAAIRKQLPEAETATDQAWARTLAAYGLTENQFNRMVSDQAHLMRFIDVRFRSNVRISQFEIEDYYNHTFRPEYARKDSGETPPLKQVQDKIQEILVEERVTEGLNSLVQSLRTQAVIRRIQPIAAEKVVAPAQ